MNAHGYPDLEARVDSYLYSPIPVQEAYAQGQAYPKSLEKVPYIIKVRTSPQGRTAYIRNRVGETGNPIDERLIVTVERVFEMTNHYVETPHFHTLQTYLDKTLGPKTRRQIAGVGATIYPKKKMYAALAPIYAKEQDKDTDRFKQAILFWDAFTFGTYGRQTAIKMGIPTAYVQRYILDHELIHLRGVLAEASVFGIQQQFYKHLADRARRNGSMYEARIWDALSKLAGSNADNTDKIYSNMYSRADFDVRAAARALSEKHNITYENALKIVSEAKKGAAEKGKEQKKARADPSGNNAGKTEGPGRTRGRGKSASGKKGKK